MIIKCVPGKVSLQELKPTIEGNQILFPVSVSGQYVKEDGRSFGYPVDDGWVTNIQYDFTMGVLTDDTIALVKYLKAPQSPSQGVSPMDTYDFPESDLNQWREGLETAWAHEQYHEWLAKGLVDQGETEDQFVTDLLDSYHSWPHDWKMAHGANWKTLNTPVGEKKTVLVNGALTLYSDENEDYFFETKYHHNGHITKADKESATEYMLDFEIYQAALAEHRRKVAIINSNIEALRSTLN